MGRKRLPDQVKKKKGTLRKGRENPSPPSSILVLSSEPPAQLSKMARLAWENIVPDLIESRIVSTLDMGALTVLCNELGMYWEIIAATKKMYSIQGQRISVNRDLLALRRAGDSALKNAIKIMGSFGLMPAERSKIIVPDPGGRPKDPMDGV